VSVEELLELTEDGNVLLQSELELDIIELPDYSVEEFKIVTSNTLSVRCLIQMVMFRLTGKQVALALGNPVDAQIKLNL
jgi:hypothetical protein